jgi:hypothetical protein
VLTLDSPGLLWLLVGFSPAAAQIPEDIQQLLHHRGHALLIGVSDYKTGWNQLPMVKDDLQDLKAGLEPYFETVEILSDPTVAKLRERMGDFLLGQWNNPGERLFIYYSGHGFTAFNQSSRDNDGYITGSDTPLYNQTDGKAVAKAVSFYEVDSWSRQTNARHVLMVFDSCFSGSLFQTMGPTPEEPPETISTVSGHCCVRRCDTISPPAAKTKRWRPTTPLRLSSCAACAVTLINIAWGSSRPKI